MRNKGIERGEEGNTTGFYAGFLDSPAEGGTCSDQKRYLGQRPRITLLLTE